MIKFPFILNSNFTHLSMVLFSHNMLTYLNSIASSQEQTNSIYFDLSQVFDKIPHTLFLRKLNNFSTSDFDIKRFTHYLNSFKAWIRVCRLEYVTLADSYKLKNTKRKFANSCYNRFIQLNSFCNYESMWNYLHFEKLYSRRKILHSFLVLVLGLV
jgi:hypothetical protein